VSGARGQAGIISVDETGCSAEVLAGIPPELFSELRQQMMPFLMSFLGSVWTLLPLSMIQFVLSIPVAVLTNFFALCSAAVIDLYQEVIGTVCDLTLCAGLAAAGAAGLIQSCILLCAGIVTCTPAALVDAAQSCSYWCGDLYLMLSTYLRDALVFVSSGVGNYVWNSWQEIIGTISALWAGFNDIDLTYYAWQSLKTFCVMCVPFVHLGYLAIRFLDLVAELIWPLSALRGCVQLCLLWNNCFVRLGQHAVPVV